MLHAALTGPGGSATLPAVSDTEDRLLLEGMVFYGYHGHRPEERTLGQRFIVDLELGVDVADAGRTDDLDKSINYAEVYQSTKRIVEGEPYDLLESVAERVAAAALEHERAEWVRVRIRKPGVAIEGVLASSGVQVFRRKLAEGR